MKTCLISILGFWMALGGTFSVAQEISVVTEEWPPFNYTENGKVIGLSTEVVEAVFAHAQIPVKITVYPWARAYNLALEDANVAIYTIGRTPERESLFHWIGPITPRAKEALYKLKTRSDIVIATIEDLKQYHIGVIRQEIVHQILSAQGFEDGTQVQAVPTQEQNIKKLFAGRIDLLGSLDLVLAVEMKKAGLTMNELAEAFVLTEGPGYLAFSKATPIEVVERVRAAFEYVNAQGLIKQVTDKYCPQ